MGLITVRSRPVSGFTSADRAGWCLQFPRLQARVSLNDTSEKLGVSLFDLVCWTTRVVNLLYDQQ